MTETATETVAELKFTDEMHELAHKQLESFITKRNDLVGRANAAHGDRVTLTEQITESSQDPEIVAARNARDEAEMRLHALVQPMVNKIVSDAEAGVSGIEEEIKALDLKLKPGMSYYKQVYGEDALKHLPAQVRTRGMSLGRGTSGGRRIRGYSVEATVDGEATGFDNFAGLAKWLDVETVQLQEAFFKAAGDPKALKDAPDEVEFDVTFTEVDEDGNESKNTASIRAFRETTTDEADTDSE